ncbi:16S rRNA (uracil(1498)-N(3))-methyltransferase [Rhodovulum sp. DZ06]|uniref:16S rRNA (uracil(1498)-N(3))-methyltransferase n=1 Tax=Rhodovulum sp. DZ06 TaxID=3425126 RepID=UPI003D33D6AE
MPEHAAKIRLFLDADLGPDVAIPLDKDQANYLFAVMRRGVGDVLRVFNGRDGEWLAEIVEGSKRGGILAARRLLRDQAPAPDLWLLFAPVKRARTDFIIEKAVELGVSRLQPVFTRRTNSERLRVDRMQATAREAAEQCERLEIPGAAAPVQLSELLADWPAERRILFCDERGQGGGHARPALEVLRAAAAEGDPAAGPGPWAVLIGPEGGFAPEEISALRVHHAALPVGLGPRILRADTAAVAALSLWQAALGDWGAASPAPDDDAADAGDGADQAEEDAA